MKRFFSKKINSYRPSLFKNQIQIIRRAVCSITVQPIVRLVSDQLLEKKVKYLHIHIQAYTSQKSLTVLFTCILSNGEVIKYHTFISVVVIEFSVRCLNTGPENRPTDRLRVVS